MFFEDRRFGGAGNRVVVEECLEGEEVSFTCLSDGQFPLPLATAKDYKRLLDDDQGPNTGGMGSHSPAGVMGSGVGARFSTTSCARRSAGLDQENRSFVGVLYVGLMLTEDGPKVLEYNVRLGDPECQACCCGWRRICCRSCTRRATGRFETLRLKFRKEASALLVLASQGYPEKPRKGEPIEGLDEASAHEGVEIFHSGTAIKSGRVVAAGGRVLGVGATGPTLRDALRKAYGTAQEISWPSKIMRHDIGRRVLQRSASG